MIKKKTLIIFIAGFAVLFSILVSLFVASVMQQPEGSSSDDGTKYFGLMSDGSKDTPDTTKEAVQQEYTERPAITQNTASDIVSNIENYLENGNYNVLDEYLQNAIETYQDSEGTEITIVDMEEVRSDIAMIESMTSLTSSLMMQSFHRPDTLISALVYLPMSCKYDSVYNVDSLIIPAPEGQVQYEEVEMDMQEKSDIFAILNENNNNRVYADIKQYKAHLYDADFDYIIAYCVTNDAWMPYLIRSSDERAYQVFFDAKTLQDMVLDGEMTDDLMDNALYYSGLDDMDLVNKDEINIQTFTPKQN